jgi:hypothetical protein
VDPEALRIAQAQRVARARVIITQLQARLAAPHLAAHMLPFGPIDVPGPGRCAGCQRLLDVDNRRGHVGEAIAKKRPRCYWWALTGLDGTPWDQFRIEVIDR